MTNIRYEIRHSDPFLLALNLAAVTCRVSVTGHDGRVLEVLDVGGSSRAKATRNAKRIMGNRLSVDHPGSKITFFDARRAGQVSDGH